MIIAKYYDYKYYDYTITCTIMTDSVYDYGKSSLSFT